MEKIRVLTTDSGMAFLEQRRNGEKPASILLTEDQLANIAEFIGAPTSERYRTTNELAGSVTVTILDEKKYYAIEQDGVQLIGHRSSLWPI